MPIDVTTYPRKFQYKVKKEVKSLSDPNPDLSPEEVLTFYSSSIPELTTATIDGPKIENDHAVYEFTTTVGTKG